MNKIIIKGRIARDIEIRHTNSGKMVGDFSVAVNRKMNREEADFINCTAWEKSAEFVNKYFSKGQEILVEGRMESDKYTDKDGNNRINWKLVVEQVDFCGGKSDNNQSSAADNVINKAAQSNVTVDVSDFEEIDGELPF